MSEQVTFALGIPTINRYDLLEPFLNKYLKFFPPHLIFVHDTGNLVPIYHHEPFLKVTRSGPHSVAASWNALCGMIFIKHTHAVIINDDLLLNKTGKQVENFIVLHKEQDFFVSSQEGFSSFIIPRKTFRTIGYFDEHFKGAYFEDKDYERRMMLGKMKIMSTPFLNPELHTRSASIGKDKKLNANYQKNAEHYKKKWGGNLGGETYTTPFNDTQ